MSGNGWAERLANKMYEMLDWLHEPLTEKQKLKALSKLKEYMFHIADAKAQITQPGGSYTDAVVSNAKGYYNEGRGMLVVVSQLMQGLSVNGHPIHWYDIESYFSNRHKDLRAFSDPTSIRHHIAIRDQTAKEDTDASEKNT